MTAAPVAGAAQTAGNAQPAIPVATRAALLLETPEEPNKVKTYIGNMVWSTTTKASGAGQITIMHGEMSVPDAQLKFVFNLQKNDDPNFPAAFLMDLRFQPDANSKVNAIKELRMPEMRQEEAARGEQLHGGAVPITPTVYLIGLSRVDRDRIINIDLMTHRAWFDVPFVLADGREAKLTFEKGIAGDRALSEVLK